MTQNVRLPRASWYFVFFFVEEVRSMFAGAPLDYRRWIKVGLPPRLPQPVPGCPRPWAPPLCPFLAKTSGSRWEFLSRSFFAVPAYRWFIWVLVQASNFCYHYSYVRRKKTGGLFLRVVQNPKSRARHLSAPPKSHFAASYSRMYSDLSLIPQSSRTY